MTRRSPKTQRDSTTKPNTSSDTPKPAGPQERVLAFAEQLGRIAVQAKTAGGMGTDAMKRELARVRDGAANLLHQLADLLPVAANKPTGGPALKRSRGRSGGV